MGVNLVAVHDRFSFRIFDSEMATASVGWSEEFDSFEQFFKVATTRMTLVGQHSTVFRIYFYVQTEI